MKKTSVKGYHLSMQQARLWAQQGENQVAYVQCAVWLNGNLNLPTFFNALHNLVGRHDILRTAFRRIPGMEIPVQIVTSYLEVDCPVIDLEHLSPLAQSTYLNKHFTDLQRSVTDLETHPLFAMTLLRLSRDKHLFIICLPALCADEYTLKRIILELSSMYVAPLDEIEPDEEPLQYAEGAEWQEQLLQSEEAEIPREYWRKFNLSQLATTHLPFDQRRSMTVSRVSGGEEDTFALRTFEVALENNVATQIRQRAMQYGVSVEAWLLACWEVVLWRLNGLQDSLLGIVCDGRTYEELTEELAKALGPYTRVVPFEIRLGGDLPFDQVVKSVNKNLLEAIKRQYYFTWEDVPISDTTNNASASHFFSLGFEYITWPTSFSTPEINFSLYKSLYNFERFLLKLNVVSIGEKIQLHFQSAPTSIEMVHVERIASTFQTLLHSGLVRPQLPVSALSLLEPAIETSLLALGSAPKQVIPQLGLHQLFEEQVQRWPDYLAVIGEQEQLTYQQLNTCANQLAHVLRQRGVVPNVLVGLCLPRQAHMLIGLLGILKAGGAYLPLDVGSPTARLTYQLHESRVTLLLTQEEARPQLPTWSGSIVCLEELDAELAQASIENLPGYSVGDDLAYVIYTSGSTGLPKGVMVRQNSVVNYTLALCKQLGAEPGWQFVTVSTLAADLGNTIIFCALASGGCVQVLGYEAVTSGEAMANWAALHPIDVLKIVPSHLSALLESERAQELLPRRALVLGGETLSAQLVEQVRQVGALCQIYNHYGPTETTIGVLVNPLEELKLPAERSGVALGRPIANTQVYVLDQWMQQVPMGIVGELYIGGVGVALGYQQQAGQTAERFMPHPYSQQGGARLYRTGDLVRYGEDGKIIFVGRSDRQVKLRGYRVEVEEIEAALRLHPLIWDCAVQLQEEGPGAPRLVSYVVARTAAGLTLQRVRDALREKLPEYMLPSSLVLLESLPLTANGKLDRRQLPQPELLQESAPIEQGMPRSPIEEMLVQMWKDLLLVSDIGVNDNFFVLGGHSLLATRVMARLQAMFQIVLPLQMLFEAPTVAGLAQRVEQMLRKDERIEMPPLVARAHSEEIPLSFAQQRLWFLDQLEPESTVYLIPRALRMGGIIDVYNLERSLQELIRRHEILRTTFAQRANRPVQIIHPASSTPLPVIDLQALRAEQREEEARRLAYQEAQHPCDLARGPLLRTFLLRVEHQEHVLLLTLHHIITDGWSNEVLVRELTTLYRLYIAGQSSSLAPLPIQYADYALWQREWLQGEVLNAQLIYWQRQLADSLPLELPTDHPRPAVQSYRGASQFWQLPAPISEGLQALSQQENVTLFMLLLAAFQVLLMRYSGQSDISVGTPIANRRQAEVDGMIGFFVNTLVLRTDLSGNPRFQDVLQRVRDVCLGAYAHQDLPFEKVVVELEAVRDLSRSPLFQVMFILQNISREQGDLAGVSVKSLNVESTISKFDLTLSMGETPQGLYGALEYNVDLFEAETIRQLLIHWQTLLEGIVQDPQAYLSELPSLPQGEQEQLFVEWNATQQAYPQDLCVHQLFEQQVQKTPDAVALVFEEQSLSYAELNRRANQLAHYLQSLGVGPDVLVAICMGRSIEMIVGMLAILKAGGTYLPLDPAYPSERLHFMLEDTHATVLLSQEYLLESLPEYGAQLVTFESQWALIGQQNRENVNSGASAANLAYVMYTSGSTGRPKGVEIKHQSILRLVFGMDFMPLAQGQTLLQLAPISFDASTFEIWGALLFGGRCVLYPEEIPTTRGIGATIDAQGVTALWLTASLFNVIIDEEPEILHGLQYLLTGGEALSVSHVRRALSHLPKTQLINGYGPTESTTFTYCYCIPVSLSEDIQSIPLGLPIRNTQVYVLDKYLNPVPVGVVGELYIGGDGLARGYVNQPELTADRFVPHPFSQKPGERLYQTGDMVRYHANGVIEFVGRRDQQVKIRGYRIELSEIEVVLGQHPSIQNSVVLVREDEPGDKRLVAYPVSRQGETLSISELRSYLYDRLPSYMIPAFFVPLAALPIAPNGKVDRRALPAPENRRLELAEAYVGPRNHIETTLVTIWSQVLHVEHIGIHDNFFALGGDSILSIQIVARARQAGLHITPRHLFQNQSIAQLSGVVTSSSSSSADQALVTGPVPLTPIQHWFFGRHLPEPHHFNQAVVLETQQRLRPAWIHQALEHLLLHHDALRLRFVFQADGWQQEIAGIPSHPFFLCVDLSMLPMSQQKVVQARLSEEAQASLRLTAGVLLRALVFQHGAEHADHLLLIIHHLAVDGVSWRILLEDLDLLCQQLSQGEVPRLVEKTVSWQHWAKHLQDYAQTEELLSAQRYWLAPERQLVPSLPVDLSRGENTLASSDTISVALDAKQTQILLQEVPSVYHTQINDVLLTALTQAFALWTGQRRLLIDLEGHGREELGEEVDISRTVGWFTTIFPVMLDLEQTSEQGEALKAIKEQLRQVPQKGLSYGVLRSLGSDAAVREQLTMLPQAEVVFNYLGQFESSAHEQSVVRLAQVPSGSAHSLLEPRDHLLEINGQMVDGKLYMGWSYSRDVHQRETIERLARSFITCLEQLIASCQARASSEYTPSDFPLVVLNQQQVNLLTQQISQVKPGQSEQQIEDIYPLSPMQAGLLFHCLYAPNTAVYCGHFGWTLQGPFNAAAWQWSWQQVIQRHPILRTFFAWQGLSEPVQVVCREVEMPWTLYDWRALSAEQRQQNLDAWRQQEEREGFDLQVAPLLRLSLIRLDEKTFYFHLALHHLLLDGWSLSRLISEVQAYYASYSLEQNLLLAPVRPYRDYIAWLRRQNSEQAEQFWRKYLLGFSTSTKLAVDRQPYASRGQADRIVDVEQLHLSEETTAELRHLAKRHQLTLNTIVQGVWALLLSRYSGETDVLFGATVSGRPADLVGIETMIGLFINTLPVRVHVSQETSLLSWLTQLQESQSEVRQYEYTPLVDIQRWSEVPIEQPLFDSLLLFQNYPFDPMGEGEESELTIQGKRSVEYTNYALTLKAAMGDRTLILQLAYDNSRFDAIMVARFMDHLQMILEAIALRPQQRLADLPMLTSAERRTLLVEWNATQASFATDMSIHELFEQQARQTPDAVALVFEETCVTYRFVNAAAERVASSLQALNIAVGASIGLCVERSLEQVIGILGILKAGGAYVPLDPAYPHERLTFMLEDSHAAALLIQPWLLDIFPDLATQSLSLTAAIVDSKLDTAIERKCVPEQIAYMIYTSGSTGRPKGTLISHRAVVNFFASMSKRPGMTADDRILAVTSFSFDIAALELLLPLTLGACVHIASQQVIVDGTELATLLAASGATLLQATPSTWGMLIAAGWMGKADLKMLCGGEALSIELALQLQPRGAVLWNMYGPTETTIWSAIENVSRADKHITIGGAINNTQLYVLDEMGYPVPLGGVGELYIAGEGMAYGYWQRPDLSAECFLPNPFDQQGGTRMYRTGDRVRWLENGVLEYQGRIDQQVKLRGHRIELNEIEAVLRDHPAVQEAVVVLRELSTDNKYLAAYIVALPGMEPAYQELQLHLHKSLPDALVPSAFLLLDSLPLTPNGKVNRKALPAPNLGQLRQDDEFIAPETTLQEQLAEIWIELLHLPQVSINRNFFALGGNSLLATRLMVRIRSVFLVEVPLRELFEAQTIAELASVIERLQIELIAQADSEEISQMLAAQE